MNVGHTWGLGEKGARKFCKNGGARVDGGAAPLPPPRERVLVEKVDFKKQFKALYAPTRSQAIHLVNVPPMRFLMIDGCGDPNSAPAYGEAVAALYALAYALKQASRSQLERDYVVPPLEGLWWSRDMSAFAARQKHLWEWTMMIMVPGWIGPAMIDRVFEAVRRKKALPALEGARVEMLEEGRCAQVLHIGPYDEEGPILETLHASFLPAHGLQPCGKHHEIYLSDPRRAASDKLRTILRQPVREKAGA